MLTERKLRQIIRKKIMEVTGEDSQRLTSIASSAREKPAFEQEKYFASQLGSSDKEVANELRKLQDLIMGGIPIDPQNKDQVSALLQKAIDRLK